MFYWMFLSVSFKRWSCSFNVTSPIFLVLWKSFIGGVFHLLLVCLIYCWHLAERLSENAANQSIGFSVLTIQVQTFRHHKRLLLSGRWCEKAFKWATPTSSTASHLSPLLHAVCSLFVEHIFLKKRKVQSDMLFFRSLLNSSFASLWSSLFSRVSLFKADIGPRVWWGRANQTGPIGRPGKHPAQDESGRNMTRLSGNNNSFQAETQLGVEWWRNRQGDEVNISGSCHERADGITAACSYSRYLQRAATGLGAQITCLLWICNWITNELCAASKKNVVFLALTPLWAAGELSRSLCCCHIDSCRCAFIHSSLFQLLTILSLSWNSEESRCQ